ncbi:MAG: hypothetical protein QM662_10670 [Gordonia sp. (in: high G+C Gram-positive bacteria)]
MSTEDDDRGSDRHRGAGAGGDGAAGDPLSDLLLALAAQIDQVAGWIGTGPTDVHGVGAALVGQFLNDRIGAEVAGEITALLREIGDLLARLIAALIAVLEAIATALRSDPATTPPPARHYQPIAVRIDADPTAGWGRGAWQSPGRTHPGSGQ